MEMPECPKVIYFVSREGTSNLVGQLSDHGYLSGREGFAYTFYYGKILDSKAHHYLTETARN